MHKFINTYLMTVIRVHITQTDIYFHNIFKIKKYFQ